MWKAGSSEKQYPDPDRHPNEKVEVLKGHFRALEGPNQEKSEWWNPDPDQHKIKMQDPDPNQSERKDPDPHQSENQDPDPHQRDADPQH